MAKNTVENQYNSPNFTPNSQVAAVFGRPRSIDYITIHWWGDPNQGPTYEGVVSWLCQPRAQVSAHDVITGTGRRVAVLVDYPNAAWHAGNSVGNATSLGFECDPRCRQEDYEAVAEDVADTWKYYGRMIPLRPHNSWTSTTCPGNYDLNKINAMAVALYNGAPAPKGASVEEVKQAYREVLEREADADGLNHYIASGMTAAQVRADLNASQEKRDLEARKAAEAAKKEWIKNLQPYVTGDTGFTQSVKLAVVPAEGVKVVNLETGSKLNDTVIPRGTNVDITAKTSVNGVPYLISNYSKSKGLANGILASSLAKPAEPPVQEKPEWLKNLQDIADKDFWTRSDTPVLKLADGTVSRTLPINSKVRITHSTQIVGINLLVLDGQTEGIETVYLSDTSISNPDEDLKKRVNALEDIVKKIVEFLSGIFKNFQAK
jgi:N-acetylmuramoyl-L-alanine amidase-like protein